MHATYRHYLDESDRHDETNDCAVRAVSVVTGWSYDESLRKCADYGRKPRKGMYSRDYHRLLRDSGFNVVNITRGAFLGSDNTHLPAVRGRTVRTAERELARHYGGCRVLLSQPRHVTAWDGEKIVDWAGGRLKKILSVHLVYRYGALPERHEVDRMKNASRAHLGVPGTVAYEFRHAIVVLRMEKKVALEHVRERCPFSEFPDTYYAWYRRDCRKKKLI